MNMGESLIRGKAPSYNFDDDNQKKRLKKKNIKGTNGLIDKFLWIKGRKILLLSIETLQRNNKFCAFIFRS